jgi:hypothetical protein
MRKKQQNFNFERFRWILHIKNAWTEQQQFHGKPGQSHVQISDCLGYTPVSRIADQVMPWPPGHDAGQTQIIRNKASSFR